MGLQDARGKLEQVTRDALIRGGITHIDFDNTLETTPRVPYASITLSFGPMVAPSLGCDAMQVRGSMVVTIATGKAQGSVQGEAAALEVLCAWVALNKDFSSVTRIRTMNQEGPITIAPSDAPVHVHTINCAFSAASLAVRQTARPIAAVGSRLQRNP